MTDQIRAALERLVATSDVRNHDWHAALTAARTALSAPTLAEGVGELALQLCWMAEAAADGGCSGDAHFLSRAAAVIQNQQAEIQRLKASALAQPAPPAEGEVGELVAALRADAECAEVEHYDLCNMTADQMRRAADLLAQRHPAPVPVSERLRYLQAGIKYGYQAGHEDTVEACFGDSSSFAEKMAPEILAEIESDALPLPQQETPMTNSLPWSTEPTVSGRYLCLRDGVFTLYDITYYHDLQMGISQWEATEVCKGTRAGWSVSKLQPAYWLLVTALPLPAGEVGEVLQWPTEWSRRQRAQEAEMLCCSAGMPPGKEMQRLVRDARDGMPLHDVHDLISHAIPAPVPVSERLPDVVEQALIKAECALADIAEGEAEECGGDSDDLLTWAEKRAAKSLARIRPVMRQHGIHTSEWPPLPTPTTPPEAQP